jgi:hypothetical protein
MWNVALPVWLVRSSIDLIVRGLSILLFDIDWGTALGLSGLVLLARLLLLSMKTLVGVGLLAQFIELIEVATGALDLAARYMHVALPIEKWSQDRMHLLETHLLY